jgi:2'-5' RNA ligase
MKCAIQLVFNNENQSIINQLRKTLIANGVHDEAVPINHISLADIEIEDNQLPLVESILKNFAKSHKSLNIVLSSVGSFMSKENVLFLTPTMTEDLMNYNDELINILTENNILCGKYYTKNNWQPHCTIAIRITDNELFAGFKTLKENNILPISVTANTIDLLCYDPKPYKELIKFELN